MTPGSGTLTLSHLTLRDGLGNYGGAVWSLGSLTLRACTFMDNHATVEGGAVQAWGDSPLFQVENCTFHGNTTDGLGAAINTGAASMTFRHVTITGNPGPSVAVALWKNPLALFNSIIAGNGTEGIGAANGGSFSPASAHNLLGAGAAPGLVNGSNGNLIGVAPVDLLLGPLGSTGGTTPTVSLNAGSPAINAGSAAASLATDQRGVPRDASPDIGAYEYRRLLVNSLADPAGFDPGVTLVTLGGTVTLPDAWEYTYLQTLFYDAANDRDDDGFNNATEWMAGSNPNSSPSIPGPTHVSRVFGFGPGRGLDLSGNFLYAFNVGPTGAAGQAGDANFTVDSAPGITVQTPNNPIADWNNPNFGATASDDVLETVYQSIRWADHLASDPEERKLRVDLAGLVPGRRSRWKHSRYRAIPGLQ